MTVIWNNSQTNYKKEREAQSWVRFATVVEQVVKSLGVLNISTITL